MDYEAAWAFRGPRLRRAAERFARRKGFDSGSFHTFQDEATAWLPDYALFAALKVANRGAPWTRWDPDLRRRNPAALGGARRAPADEIGYHEFVQYAFDRQWTALRSICEHYRVRLLGELPLFVALDSADVWANPDLFHLDAQGLPLRVAELWPNASRKGEKGRSFAAYRWDAHFESGFSWWLRRVEHALSRFDALGLADFGG
ncbi:MAG: 4-alpha-glucanotransferase [Polyangiaceae bacterium]|nr:4-alpha-glucanotransferase [Polyangiaceae bacterium]